MNSHSSHSQCDALPVKLQSTEKRETTSFAEIFFIDSDVIPAAFVPRVEWATKIEATVFTELNSLSQIVGIEPTPFDFSINALSDVVVFRIRPNFKERQHLAGKRTASKMLAFQVWRKRQDLNLHEFDSTV